MWIKWCLCVCVLVVTVALISKCEHPEGCSWVCKLGGSWLLGMIMAERCDNILRNLKCKYPGAAVYWSVYLFIYLWKKVISNFKKCKWINTSVFPGLKGALHQFYPWVLGNTKTDVPAAAAARLKCTASPGNMLPFKEISKVLRWRHS